MCLWCGLLYLDGLELEELGAQSLSSAFSGMGAFIPGNLTVFVLEGSTRLASRISPSSLSSLDVSSPKIVIPEGWSSMSASEVEMKFS